MEKGFTLIELLAVIIIIGIISTITIPRVNNVIQGARDASFVQNNIATIRATENYLSSNSREINLDFGDVIQISYEHLEVSGFKEKTQNPHGSNFCTGFVNVVKNFDSSYSITPFTDCIKGIDSYDSMGLVVHYGFGDYQEPTINLFSGELITAHQTTFLETSNERFNDGYIISTESSGHSAQSVYAVLTTEIPSGAPVNVSYYTDDPSSPGRFNLRYNTTRTTSDITFENYSGNRMSEVLYTPSGNVTNRVRIYPNTLGEDFSIYGLMIESKPYPTLYTEDSRDGTVINYASDDFHATLGLNNSPRWVDEGANGTGAYHFDGSNKMIRSDNDILIDGDQTFSFWMKPQRDSGLQGLVSLHNHSQTANLGINLHNNTITTSIGYTDGTREWNETRSNYMVSYDIWQHVTVVYDQSNNELTYYINGAKDSVHSLTKEVDFRHARVLVGQWANSYMGHYIYEGYLDDVMIFDKALSSNQVRQLYLSSLR